MVSSMLFGSNLALRKASSRQRFIQVETNLSVVPLNVQIHVLQAGDSARHPDITGHHLQ